LRLWQEARRGLGNLTGPGVHLRLRSSVDSAITVPYRDLKRKAPDRQEAIRRAKNPLIFGAPTRIEDRSMKPKLALLAATAVAALSTIAVAGAIKPLFNDRLLPALSGAQPDESSGTFVLASNHGERHSRSRHRSDNDDDEDDDNRRVTAKTAPARQAAPASAPARAVAPLSTAPAAEAARPANRLFGNGDPPKAQVN
jgi:hypothetical protein